MKRRHLLIAACIFAALSLGLNIWLLVLRNNKSSATGIAAPSPASAATGPVLQPVTMDFSGTAFADGSWKLTDNPEAVVGIDEKPFSWDDVPAAGQSKVALWPEQPEPPRDQGSAHEIRKPASTGTPSAIEPPPQNRRGFRGLEIPPYLDLPVFDPNNVRDKALLAYPPTR